MKPLGAPMHSGFYSWPYDRKQYRQRLKQETREIIDEELLGLDQDHYDNIDYNGLLYVQTLEEQYLWKLYIYGLNDIWELDELL